MALLVVCGLVTIGEASAGASALIGHGGWCPASATGVGNDDLVATELSGVELVGGPLRENTGTGLVLHAVTPGCRPAEGFGDRGTVTIRTDVEIDSIAPSTGGRVLLAGSVARHAVVGRLLADGRMDDAFGHGGWVVFRPTEKRILPGFPLDFGATSVSQSSSGVIYVAGTDGSAHCCLQDFVAALSPQGSLIAGFGRQGSLVIPQLEGSYDPSVFPQGAGRVLLEGLIEFTGCGGPVVVEVDEHGTLERVFDQSVAAVIADSTHKLLFQSALFLRPGGGFGLAGDLGFYGGCGSRADEGGLALGLTAEGRLDPGFGTGGRANLPFDGDNVLPLWAVPGAGGSTVVGTEVSAPSAQAVRLRKLSASGALERSFGHDGTLSVSLASLAARGQFVAVELVAGPGHTVVVAAGTTTRIQLFFVRT